MKLFNTSPPSDAYMSQWIGPALVQIMACCLFDTKPLSEPMLRHCQLDLWEHASVKVSYGIFHSRKCIGKYRLWKGGHFVQGKMSKKKCVKSQKHHISHIMENQRRDTIQHSISGSTLDQITAWNLFSAKPLTEHMLTYRQLDPKGTNFTASITQRIW